MATPRDLIYPPPDALPEIDELAPPVAWPLEPVAAPPEVPPFLRADPLSAPLPPLSSGAPLPEAQLPGTDPLAGLPRQFRLDPSKPPPDPLAGLPDEFRLPGWKSTDIVPGWVPPSQRQAAAASPQAFPVPGEGRAAPPPAGPGAGQVFRTPEESAIAEAGIRQQQAQAQADAVRLRNEALEGARARREQDRARREEAAQAARQRLQERREQLTKLETEGRGASKDLDWRNVLGMALMAFARATDRSGTVPDPVQAVQGIFERRAREFSEDMGRAERRVTEARDEVAMAEDAILGADRDHKLVEADLYAQYAQKLDVIASQAENDFSRVYFESAAQRARYVGAQAEQQALRAAEEHELKLRADAREERKVALTERQFSASRADAAAARRERAAEQARAEALRGVRLPYTDLDEKTRPRAVLPDPRNPDTYILAPTVEEARAIRKKMAASTAIHKTLSRLSRAQEVYNWEASGRFTKTEAAQRALADYTAALQSYKNAYELGQIQGGEMAIIDAALGGDPTAIRRTVPTIEQTLLNIREDVESQLEQFEGGEPRYEPPQFEAPPSAKRTPDELVGAVADPGRTPEERRAALSELRASSGAKRPLLANMDRAVEGAEEAVAAARERASRALPPDQRKMVKRQLQEQEEALEAAAAARAKVAKSAQREVENALTKGWGRRDFGALWRRFGSAMRPQEHGVSVEEMNRIYGPSPADARPVGQQGSADLPPHIERAFSRTRKE